MALALLLAVAVGLLARALVEPYLLQLNRVELRVSDLPAELEGFRILHVSDLHVSRFGARQRQLVRACARPEAACDMLAVTGDFIAKRADALEPVSRALRGIVAALRPSHAFAVLGNNDYDPSVPRDRLLSVLHDVGLTVLLNEHSVLRVGPAEMVVGGTEDPVWQLDNVAAAFRDAPQGAFRLMLSHSPHPYDRPGGLARAGVRVLLVGHTHGGQVCLPGGVPLYLATSHITKHTAGVFRQGRTIMFVTRGVGVNRLPVRLFCRPEIDLLVLVRE